MTIDARLSSLDQRHRELDTQLVQELRRPRADDIRIHQLKRRKLAIKDEMSSLSAPQPQRQSAL